MRRPNDLAVLMVTEAGNRPETAALAALQRAGVRIRVLGTSPLGELSRLEEAGVPVEPLFLRGGRDASAVEVIRWHLDDFRPAVLHARGVRAVLNGMRAAAGSAVRIVVQRDGAGAVNPLRPVDRVALLSRRIDRIVCIVEAVRRGFLGLRLGPFRLPAEKVVTIYQGHDLSWYRCEPADLVSFGVPRGAFVAASITEAGAEQPLKVLIRAAEHLPAGLPIHFLLAGPGGTVPGIAQQLRRSPYRDRFHALGFRRDVAALLAASDVGVLPGARRSTLPASPIEIMACGAAPIVADLDGSGELVEHERSGLIVPPGDSKALGAALLRLYVDRDACRELARNARRRVATAFTVEKAAARMLALYLDLARGARGSFP